MKPSPLVERYNKEVLERAHLIMLRWYFRHKKVGNHYIRGSNTANNAACVLASVGSRFSHSV